MRSVRLLLASLFALTAAVAQAEPTTLMIDQGHSQVGFNIRHFFSKVQGHFNEFEGTVVYDDKDVTKSSVDVTIKSASINTNQDRRDADLRSSNFFATDSFPTITFKSTKVTPNGENKLKVEGDLTMRGITHPVTLDATLLGMGPAGPNGKISGWEATTTINRKDYNIVWNRTLDQGGTMLGDDVAIVINLEARTPRPPGGGPPPTPKK
jgi:polyisoprenoid-binding protein YceI